MQFRLLRPDEIEARIGTITENGLSLLLYKDARCDMNILDEVFGNNNWQRHHELIDGQLFCTVTVWDDQKQQWISKQDVGTESYTEKEKGRASDSFKRACFNLGIGRELYTAPFIWWPKETLDKLGKDSKGRLTCRDRFIVEDIAYVDRKIKSVKIRNKNSKKVKVFETDARSVSEVMVPTETQIQALKNFIDNHGLNMAGVLLKANIMSLDNITSDEYNRIAQIAKQETEGKKNGSEG